MIYKSINYQHIIKFSSIVQFSVISLSNLHKSAIKWHMDLVVVTFFAYDKIDSLLHIFLSENWMNIILNNILDDFEIDYIWKLGFSNHFENPVVMLAVCGFAL